MRVFLAETDTDLPRFLVRFLRSGDRLAFLSEGHAEILIERRAKGTRPTQLLYAAIGYTSLPKADQDGSGFFVRADLPNCSTGPKTLFLPGADIRRYFYLLDGDATRQTLCDLLQTSDPWRRRKRHTIGPRGTRDGGKALISQNGAP